MNNDQNLIGNTSSLSRDEEALKFWQKLAASDEPIDGPPWLIDMVEQFKRPPISEKIIIGMIDRYAIDLNKMLAHIGVSSIVEFYTNKDELLKKSFHKADDIISMDDSIKRLKATISHTKDAQ